MKQLEKAKTDLETNALVSILLVFLECKEMELAKALFPSLSLWIKLCTLLSDTVGSALCQLVSEQIQTLYREVVTTPQLTKDEPEEEAGEMQSAIAIPATASLDQVIGVVFEPIKAIMESGCIISHPKLYCQLCRLLRALVEKEDCSESLSGALYSVLKVLVASLSLFVPSPAIAGDLWSLLSILPYPTRYRLYHDWRGSGLEMTGLSSKPLPQVKSEMEAGRAARYALKRLSKENVRDMGRQMAKVTHSNPLVVFTTILSQIESYDNLIEMMVESVRAVTPLGLDVLGFCILSRLSGSSDGGSGRSRVKGATRIRISFRLVLKQDLIRRFVGFLCR
jgi:THO complex subunit 2